VPHLLVDKVNHHDYLTAYRRSHSSSDRKLCFILGSNVGSIVLVRELNLDPISGLDTADGELERLPHTLDVYRKGNPLLGDVGNGCMVGERSPLQWIWKSIHGIPSW
jgi:hypothetical protein